MTCVKASTFRQGGVLLRKTNLEYFKAKDNHRPKKMLFNF